MTNERERLDQMPEKNRTASEQRLVTAELQLAEAERIAQLGSWDWDLLERTIRWSDEHCRIFGLRPDEVPITFDVLLDFVHAQDRSILEDAVRDVFSHGRSFECRFKIVRRDAAIRTIQMHGRASNDVAGRPVRAYGIVLDVTERGRAEEAFRGLADRLRAMSRRVVEIQEEERRHLAHELHDEIGQVLSAIAVNLNALKGSQHSASRIDESLRLIECATQQVRNLSLDLRPSMLDDLGLIATLRWYADRQAQRAGFALHFVADAAGDPLAGDLQIVLYRVVQEVLTNIVRHAQVRVVRIELVVKAEESSLTVTDDGIGFDLRKSSTAGAEPARPASFGVLGMRERVELAGGEFEIESEPQRGTRIRVLLPLSSA